tara:strand:- start:587 stop:1453 length:867 start_codon:yes stop_codon:yes gene_type:complete
MKFIKYFLQSIIILFLLLIFKLIGYKNASNFGSIIGRVLGKYIRSDKIILKNISIINEYNNLEIKNSNEIIKNVFSNYGRILSDYVYLKHFRGGYLEKYVDVIGNHILEDIKTRNKKVVFISGHFNNFELMAMFLEASGINLAAIYRPLNNIFLNKKMENIRLKYICKNQIKKGKSGSRELIKFIKKNYSIALMIDQRVSEGLRCNLFGKPAFTTTIPAQIIKKFDYEIVPVHIERYDKIKFKLTIEKPLKFGNSMTLEEITSELNEVLEKMILKNPYQWILTHNRWK